MYISVDLGGTKTRVASSRDLDHIVEENIFKTDQNLECEQKDIVKSVYDVLNGEEISGICVGVPGLVDKKTRKLKQIVNVHEFSNIPFTEIFDNEFDDSLIIVENDATLGALGEAVHGAGKNYDVVAYLTLSTGVGGARIAGKKIDQYERFSEPGHMLIKEDSRVFAPCHQVGCLSSFVSGTGFRELYAMSPADCTDIKVWTDYAKNLSLGILNVISLWGPDVVVLGGSLSNAYEQYFKAPLLEELSKQDFFEIPPIVKSDMGENAGVIGGFVLLSQLATK